MLFYAARLCSPSWWLITRPAKRAGTDVAGKAAAYQLAWLALLVVLLAVGRPSQPWRSIIVALATLRWVEIATYSLGLVLATHWPKTAGSLVTVAVYALQIALIFAIIEQCLVPHDFVDQAHKAAAGHFDYLYISWTNMTTLGNEYAPVSAGARVLRVGSVTSGVLLLSVIAARTLQFAYEAGQRAKTTLEVPAHIQSGDSEPARSAADVEASGSGFVPELPPADRGESCRSVPCS